MTGPVMRNGKIEGPEALLFSLADNDVCYGYGCYETLKVRGGLLYLPEFHAERLIASAEILGIRHETDATSIVRGLGELVAARGEVDCNVKVMLIGHDDRPADWYAFALPAIYPPSDSAERGVRCLAFRGERHFPRAKSLSMLLSTVAFRRASSLGCYDALLVNRREELTEGTRTNLFFADARAPGRAFTPPEADVLSGITRKTCLQALADAGFPCEERALALSDIRSGHIGVLVSSTSTGLVPVRELIGPENEKGEPYRLPFLPELSRVVDIYSRWLESYRAAAR